MQPSRWRPIHATLALAVTAISGCGEETHPFYPLDAGRTWHYAVETTILDEIRTSRITISNLGAGTDATGTVYLQRHQPTLDRYFRLTPRGVERRDKDDDAFSVVLPRSLEIGSGWTVASDLALVESRTFSRQDRLRGRAQPFELELVVTSLDATVATPAGRFTGCLQVEGHGATTVRTDRGNASGQIIVAQTDWYAPGVGLVRSERLESSESPFLKNGSYRQVLIAFGR